MKEIRDIFKRGGRLSKGFSSYEYRPEQVEMARAVAGAIKEGGHLLVEAGTGVGKSLAYLIPFVLWSLKEGKRVLISTYTKALQAQLMEKDIPFLKEALGVEFKSALCLGSENFLCLRRFFEGSQIGLFEDEKERKALARISEWVKKAWDGLKQELNFDLPASLWKKISRQSDLCLANKCPHRKKCYYNKARAKQRQANLLICNHHLFFANLAQDQRVLPQFKAVVFDEAHTLEEVATNYLGLEISNFKVKFLLNSLYNPKTDRGLLKRVSGSGVEKIKEEVAEAGRESEVFFRNLAEAAGAYTGTWRIKEKDFLTNILEEPFERLLASLRKLLKEIEDEEMKIELLASVGRAAAILKDLDFILKAEDEGFVYWAEIGGGRLRRQSLKATPISIAGILKERVFDRISPVVLTSATLSTAGNFGHIKSCLGLCHPQELRLDSPFNFKEQVALYLPENIPDPTIDLEAFKKGITSEIISLLAQNGGRTFVLFTNFKMMEEVYQKAAAELPSLNFLKQGDLPTNRLIEVFKKEKAVLFGVNTFWQGVDIPGEALSCIIITKLPFAVPDDP
ncbi:DEAD/DEAH box helicase, partial [bacterium]|nr:DEAD/DEAH box helicase [bacterium]